MTNVKNGWITDESGTKRHYVNGKLHREDGPAIYNNGDVAYFKNGVLHNDNGPATLYKSGSVEYWVNGKRHREDGPALIYSNGVIKWYLNDKIYSFEDYCKKLNLSQEQILKLKLKYDL